MVAVGVIVATGVIGAMVVAAGVMVGAEGWEVLVQVGVTDGEGVGEDVEVGVVV